MGKPLAKWECPECHEELYDPDESVEACCHKGHVCLVDKSNSSGRRHVVYRGYQVRSWSARVYGERSERGGA